MQVQVHFSFHDEAEFITFTQRFSGSLTDSIKSSDSYPASIKAGEKETTLPAKKETVKKEEPKEPTFNQKMAAKVETEEKAIKTNAKTKLSLDPVDPTYDNVKEYICEVARVKQTKTDAVAILKKYGASKVGPELQEKDYGSVIADCQAILAVA